MMMVVGGVAGTMERWMFLCERWACEHHQQHYGGKNSLHEKNVPRRRLVWKRFGRWASTKERVRSTP